MPTIAVFTGVVTIVLAALTTWGLLIVKNPRRWRWKRERRYGIVLDDVVADPQRFHRDIRLRVAGSCLIMAIMTAVFAWATVHLAKNYKTPEEIRQEQQQRQERWERESQEAHKSFDERFGKPLGDPDARKPPKE
jgi:hypothetical protein